MEYVGHSQPEDEVVFRGDVDDGAFLAFWLRQQRVTAAMNVNIWDVNDGIRELIRSRHTVDARMLADPDVPIDALIAAATENRA